jgi:predicted regulator of Ras-like GTPase activity (Roadblock/LC7/MglB family)
VVAHGDGTPAQQVVPETYLATAVGATASTMMGAAAVDHSDGSTGPMTGEPLAMVFSSDC